MQNKEKMPAWVFLTILFVVLQLLDGVLTSLGVSFYGLEMEANPIAAYTFSKYGIIQSAIVWKAVSFLIFFSLLFYCLYVGWSMMDVVGLLWKREPRKDRAYAMSCFNVAAVIMTSASLYASGGWMYILLCLH